MRRGALVLLLAGRREGIQSILDPRGPAAAELAGLWSVLFWVCLAVFAAFTALTIGAVVRASRADGPSALDARRDYGLILVGGALIPAVVLVYLTVVTVRTGTAVSPRGIEANVELEVIGHQFWWEVRYPELGIVTANEIRIPVGEPVRVRVRTADVIHSFWVPNLHGKIDMIPGMLNTIWLEADEPGTFRGQCAEFCGAQHARMAFYVIAESRADFEAWAAREASPAAIPTEPFLRQGLQAFVDYECGFCHNIRGVVEERAVGEVGPDLTHLMSRRMLAAGTLANTRGNLAGWILDPQGVKPGNRMPGSHLDPASLDALLAYLETLQ